jgi:hypothetical protein
MQASASACTGIDEAAQHAHERRLRGEELVEADETFILSLPANPQW